MKLLRVIASVDPATGGPVSGLRAITPALEKLGHRSEFLTADPPLEGYLQSFVAPVHAVGPGRGSYSYSPRVKPWLRRNLPRFDAVIVHGLWQCFGPIVRSVARELGKPYYVFPHGMLDPSLRSTYPIKHIKKWLYWVAMEHRVLRDAQAVFFTCEEERRLARKTFPGYRCTERVVAYGTAAPEGDPAVWQRAWSERSATLKSHRYFLFLGRLHSKKGVDVLIRGYAKLVAERAQTRSETPDLVLAGPCLDAGYLNALQTLAKDAGIAAKVHWPGMLTGDAKWGALAAAEAFVLPSHQENFGIAVAEALACGTPVLLSDRVNIWREIADANAAIVEPPTEDGAARLLRRWLTLNSETQQAMRAAARACFAKRFEVSHAAKNLIEELTRTTSS